MGITCANCGATNIAPGRTQCPVCNQPISAAAPSLRPGSGLAPSPARPVLVDPRGRQYPLNPNASQTMIGSRGCAILLSDPGVPAQAARLVPQGAGFLLEDISGAVRVNGGALSSSIALKPGDKINIGATTLVYQGPATIAPAPAAPPATVIPYTPPVKAPVSPLPSPAIIPATAPPVALKNWGKNPPVVEGAVELVDGPHRVEKGSTGAKVATSLALGLISSTLMMLPFWMKSEVNVWFLRIKEYSGGRMVSVVLRGEPGSLPQLGDFIAVWGAVKDGNVMMERGYSYTTDSNIPIKK